MITAMTAWDLARMSRGRFMLGLGTQVRAHIVRRFSTTWDRPVPRLREYILALRAIWGSFQDSSPLAFDGDFYQFSLMTPFFNPGPIPNPDVPIYIAGVGPYLSRLAGELCSGFHVHPFHTVRYLDEVVLPGIAAGAAGSGRTLDDVELATTVFVMTGATDSDVEQAMGPVRQQIAFYASTPSYLPVLEAEGWDFGGELERDVETRAVGGDGRARARRCRAHGGGRGDGRPAGRGHSGALRRSGAADRLLHHRSRLWTPTRRPSARSYAS